MTATQPYKFIGLGAMTATKPYKFIGFGAMTATKPYKFIGFGAMTVNPTSEINVPARSGGTELHRALPGTAGRPGQSSVERCPGRVF